jgi:hypothetical protein
VAAFYAAKALDGGGKEIGLSRGLGVRPAHEAPAPVSGFIESLKLVFLEEPRGIKVRVLFGFLALEKIFFFLFEKTS